MPHSVILSLAVTAGVAAGVFGDPAVHTIARWIAALSTMVALAAHARGARPWVSRAAITAVAAVGAVIGSSAQHRALHAPLREFLDARVGGFAIDGATGIGASPSVVVEGVVRADAALTGTGAAMRIDVLRIWLGPHPESVAGGVALSVSGVLVHATVTEWRAGRTVRAPVQLRRPARYLNAGVPDYERLLARRRVTLVGSVKSAALVEVVAAGHPVDEWAARARARVRRVLAARVGTRDPQSAAVATAILIGDRGALDPDVERRLQEAGTYHVIAISGGNIAILAGLVLAALWWLHVPDRWAAGAAIGVLGAYAFFRGGGPSVMRATVMAVIYLALRTIDQRTPPAHAIALTAMSLLLVDPLSIADVGFWLTFGATGAIVVGASRARLPAAAWFHAPAILVLASACAEGALMPIGVAVFQRVTLAGLIVNLAAVPCMAAVQIGSMVAVAADAAGLGAVASAAGWGTHLAVRGLIDSAALVDVAPWLTWRVPSPSLWLIGAYYSAVALWLFAWRSADRSVVNRRRLAATTAVLLFLWIAVAPQTLARVRGDGRLHVTLMDVGQGDAVLVTLPNGRTALVDAGGVSRGGDFDIGDRVLGPALRARGLGRLDYVAVTHGDLDHIGGVASVARDFSPAEIWDGVFVANHSPTELVRQMALRRRSTWRSLQAGDRFEIGGVEWRVHHPPLPDWERQWVRNDDSLVFELRYGQVSVLLTGDIGREVEQALIPTLDLLPTVVLKSPHHGSGTSSSAAFIDAIRPAVVLISCGRGNSFGHPVPYVLERYHAVGAQVLRTDLEGQIEVVTDGVTVTAATYTGRLIRVP